MSFFTFSKTIYGAWRDVNKLAPRSNRSRKNDLFLNQIRTQTFLKMLQSTLGEEHCVLHDRLLKGKSF